MLKGEKKYPRVSIVTINYNQPIVTCALLESLRKITYPDYEIIVVDNDSPDEDPDIIKKLYPEARLIKSDKNLGFAGGNNLGIKQATGKYLFFLNNDTEVLPGVLEPMVELLEENPDVGAVSPKIRFYYHPDLIQYAGFSKMNPWTIRNRGIGYRKPDGPQFNKAYQTNSIHGAAMMVPRSVIDRIGPMPEEYFLYYEEHDWAESIKRAGYNIYFQPESTVLHKESVSTGKSSPMKTYYITRNRMLFARRNFNNLPFVFSVLFQTFISHPKNILLYLIRGEFPHLKSYLSAIGWHLRNIRLPEMKKN